MRKIASLLMMLMFFSALAFGQNRNISGRVTDEAGDPVPGASVRIRGTNTGVAADNNGQFRISAKTGDVLDITGSNIVATSATVGAGDVLNVTVRRTVAVGTEVVVTALGIRRKPEEIGYSTATVRPDQIQNGRQFNLAQSLAGKVSGLNISNTSNSVNGTPRIVLRGLRSLTGDNTALIVLDGVAVPANTINYINPNDVERVDIMKGGQAATLFGSDGVNGAIVITTKKGSARPEFTITHTSNAEKVSYLPKFQETFGSGSAYGSSREENFHPAENQQYGPAYDGSIRPLGRVLADGSVLLVPYAHIDGIREKIWNTGYTGQTDLAYRAGDMNSNIYVSFQHLNSNGIVPGDEYERNSLRFNAGKQYGKVNVSFDGTYTWDKADRTNTDFYFWSLNSPSWAPMDQLRDWRNNKFADLSGYFNDYYNNPWWLLDNVRFNTAQKFFNGNIKLTYKPTNALEFTGRVGIANTDATTHTHTNQYTFSNWSKSVAYLNYNNNDYDRALTGFGRFVARTPIAGAIGESFSNGNRLNADVFGTWNKEFNDFSLKLIAGGNLQVRKSKAISANMNGLAVPDLFNFGNTVNGLYTAGNSLSEVRKIAGYGDVTLGWKNMIYLHGVLRNDYTSVFYNPALGFESPSYTTYGGDISIILSDLVPQLKNNVIDAIKIRGGYNKNGNDNLNAYQLAATYSGAAGFPYAGLVGFTQNNTTVSGTLAPEDVKTAEVGLEMSFLKNRINFEASFYKQKSEKQILSVGISPASGYTTYRLNAADLDNKGLELDLRVNAFRNRDWNINVTGNYAWNKNEVNTLYGNTGLNELQLQGDNLVSLNATLGQMFPYLKTTVYERDSEGRVIVDPTDGWPIRAADLAGQGTTTPIHILGAGVNVAWKNLTLIANAEYRGGHVVYHDLGTDMTFTGTSALTTIYNRDQFVWPNSSYWDGTKYVPNTNIAVDNYKAIYQGFGDQAFSRGMAGTGEFYVSSGAFWKLRDLSLSYDLPAKFLNAIKAVKGISITAWARNLVVLLPDDNWFTDPEFSNTNGNAQGINTSLNTPPTRQIGGTIKVVF